MKDRIKFNNAMLAAVIDGSKTQTRRPIEPQPKLNEEHLRQMGSIAEGFTLGQVVNGAWQAGFVDVDCPYGQIGDTINFADKDGNIKGKIEITDVWIQQIKEISQQDAIEEGSPPSHHSIDSISIKFGFPDFSRSCFAQTWIDIYGEDSWVNNEWVWVIEFIVIN